MALSNLKIERSLQPGAQALGVELVAVEMAGGDQTILRIYIDKEGGVSIDDCAKASHQFSAILDVEDPISNRYTLEVSSPGLDRPLARPEHFKLVVGEDVKIRMASLVAGRKRFKGQLKSASDEDIVIAVDGVEHTLALSDMEKARLVPTYDFTPVNADGEED